MLRDFKDIRFRADSNIDPETSTIVLVTAALILGSHHVKLQEFGGSNCNGGSGSSGNRGIASSGKNVRRTGYQLPGKYVLTFCVARVSYSLNS